MNKKILIFIFFILCEVLYCFRTDVLNYRIYKTSNFDIYYSHNALKKIIIDLENILEKAIIENSEYFEIKFDYRIPFFIYYGYQQFLQNRIVDVSEHTGGVTEAFKNRFLVPYNGSMKFLQHVINHEFIHEVEYNVLYSGVWRTPLLLKSIFYPHWLMEGLAEYRASLFTKTIQEMLVRDMAVSNKLIPLEHLHNFSHLKPHMILPAYEQSAKLMEFIDKEYGRKKLVSLLKLYREKFEANSVLNSILGMDIKKLQKLFFEEMSTHYNYEVKHKFMEDLDTSKKISKQDIYPVHYQLPVVFENNVIYLGDPEGKVMFYIRPNNKNKQHLLISKRLLEKKVDIIHTDSTRLSISKDGVLCFVGIKNNKSYLYLYNLKNKKLEQISLKEIELLTSSYISYEGNKIYISGVKDCLNILGVYDINAKKFFIIHQDKNFISQISVSKDSKKLLYIKEQECVKREYQTWQNDIFMFDLEKNQEIRLTYTLSDEFFPMFLDEENILFISDYNEEYDVKFYGVKNLFYLSLDNPLLFKKITNVIGGIVDFYIYNNTIFLTYYRDFNQHIYKYDLKELITIATPITQKMVSEQIISYKENILRKDIPYKFYFSTDLFLPFLYYSSYEGLMMLLYWQASDMVGEHNVGVNSVVLGNKNYSLNLEYRFLKFRPAFIFSVTAESSYDYYKLYLDRYISLISGITYPLSRNSYLDILIGYIYNSSIYEDQLKEEVKKENVVYMDYVRNTIIGKFVAPLRGDYLFLSFQIADKIIDGDYLYQIYRGYFLKYFHLGKEYCVYTNLQFLISTGRDKKSFNLGGPERISGIWYGDKKSEELYLSKIGFRFPIVYDINYYMWYLFPDLFFKGFYGEVFIDLGFDRKLNFYDSFGIKFNIYSFVIQSYLLKFELIFANEIDLKKPIYTYFLISGGF
ncbi:MAG: hypothetical protein RMJ67_07360 [Elusimicrobiota bacterium]|nr:hypothetical protein [Endomicrobiia bacterium]MDW8166310.1 hypothetical protein [Elusimicrobiota bacterium]